jgi:hypothetical protein
MKVRDIRTQQISHVDASIGKMMIASGVATEIPQLPHPGDYKRKRLVPQWDVNAYRVGNDEEILGVRMEIGATVCFYFGKPEHLNWKRDHAGNIFDPNFGRMVPENICKEYTRQYQKNPEQTMEFSMSLGRGAITNRALCGGDNVPNYGGDPVAHAEQVAFNKENGDLPRAGVAGTFLQLTGQEDFLKKY